jgi:hypothetical protein
MSLHGGIIQSVLFNKKMWSVLDSVNWCLNNGHKVINITDEPNDKLKVHQESALKLKRKGYIEYKIKNAGYGVDFMIVMKPNVEIKYDLDSGP